MNYTRPHAPAASAKPVPGRVLCIEDDPVVQLMLNDIVANAGARCVIAGTAREAEDILGKSTFDLILLDRRLPDSDGLLLLQTIKESGDCPVVVLSAMDNTRDKILGIGMGAAEYVTKPFNPLELGARIRQLLNERARTSAEPPEDAFEIGRMSFDPRTRCLRIGDATSFLPPTEGRLLRAFLLNEGDPQSRDQLSRAACGREWSPRGSDRGRARRPAETAHTP